MGRTNTRTRVVTAGIVLVLAFGGALVSHVYAQAPANTKIPDLTGIWDRVGPIPGKPLKEAVVTARALGFARAFDEVMMPGYDCSPVAIPVLLGDNYNFQILQQPDRVIMKYEKEDVVRTVWLEGHGHPAPGPYDFTVQGYSSGRYEGPVLVIETSKFVFDPRGISNTFLPTTTSKKVTERYWREGKYLRMDSVTTDPWVLREPLEYSFQWEPTQRPLEVYGCDPEYASSDRHVQPSKYRDPDFVRIPPER